MLKRKIVIALVLSFFSLFAVQCGAAPPSPPSPVNNSVILDRVEDDKYPVVCWVNHNSGDIFCIPKKEILQIEPTIESNRN